MGYYIRVLSTAKECVPVKLLEASLKSSGFPAILESTRADPAAWQQLLLRHLNGNPIANIERDVVETGSLGEEELAEFHDEVADSKPESAASWLQNYFRKVQCIYAFQVLSGAYVDDGWDALEIIRQQVFSFAPSISQADGEGFTNEQGAHILWQFADNSPETWWMAVLQEGEWVTFDVDLGNENHREAFFRGDVPAGITPDKQT